ncbi:iron-containing alcohol dehydrogenase [Bacillus daqingensis]|uniref:Iron-containing alcohol dehydrogenase n=1 Tax=Bacillus daqingensis TaxID=872396 RepID=A0ABV9NSJ3_9BACI
MQVLSRLYQSAFYIATPFLPWRTPELLEGPGTLKHLPALLQHRNLQRILVVTDAGVEQAGLLGPLLDLFEQKGMTVDVWKDVTPDPTSTQAASLAEAVKRFDADAIAAVGGGSVIDCAKAARALIARPDRSLSEMRGVLKIRRRGLFFAAVPTTAGTGSEATAAAVITDADTHEKYALIDTCLIPDAAVLDAALTVQLPKRLTAAVGMDALTHAVEAFISRSRTNETDRHAAEAVRLLVKHLPIVYQNGDNLESRRLVLHAAHLAGLAFTKAFIGNVHALAHQLGAQYRIPHGEANAMLLVPVLRQYGSRIYPRLEKLAAAAGLSQTDGAAFIELLNELRQSLDLPAGTESLQTADYPAISRAALREANPLYPVPVMFSERDMYEVLRSIHL